MKPSGILFMQRSLELPGVQNDIASPSASDMSSNKGSVATSTRGRCDFEHTATPCGEQKRKVLLIGNEDRCRNRGLTSWLGGRSRVQVPFRYPRGVSSAESQRTRVELGASSSSAGRRDIQVFFPSPATRGRVGHVSRRSGCGRTNVWIERVRTKVVRVRPVVTNASEGGAVDEARRKKCNR
jgi:hypothetical protein